MFLIKFCDGTCHTLYVMPNKKKPAARQAHLVFANAQSQR